MINYKRDGKITILELLIIAIICVSGYFVFFAPISKTNDMVKEEWIRKNLSTIHDATNSLKKDEAFALEEMTINDVDILRANWGRTPMEWPNGVNLDSFKVSSNKVTIVAEFSTGTNVVTFVPKLPEE